MPIVMDNAPYHSVQMAASSVNKKEHMEQARLVRCDKVYVVDGMAWEAEHEVIRLPLQAMKRYVAYNSR